MTLQQSFSITLVVNTALMCDSRQPQPVLPQYVYLTIDSVLMKRASSSTEGNSKPVSPHPQKCEKCEHTVELSVLKRRQKCPLLSSSTQNPSVCVQVCPQYERL